MPFHDWLLTVPSGPVRPASVTSWNQYRVESDGSTSQLIAVTATKAPTPRASDRHWRATAK